MAIVAHLVERVFDDGDNDLRNGIRAIIVAIDDAVDTTGALIQARAVTVLNARNFDIPVGYFGTNRVVVSTFAAAGDLALFTSKIDEVVA